MNVLPDFDGLAGIGDLREIVGALLMFALVIAVLMLIVSAIIWAVSSSTGNYAAASKGRVGVLVSLGGAVLAGAGVAWMNWLIGIGQQLGAAAGQDPLGTTGGLALAGGDRNQP